MRPQILYPLFADITTLDGVGEKTAKSIEKLAGGRRILDIVFHIPYNFIDRRYSPSIYEVKDGEVATFEVIAETHFPQNSRSKTPYKIHCCNDTGSLQVVYFHAYQETMERIFPLGKKVVISGKVEIFEGMAQMVHPDYVVPVNKIDEIKIIEPVYRLTAGISNRQLGKIIKEAVEKIPQLPEWISKEIKNKYAFEGWNEALKQAHDVALPSLSEDGEQKTDDTQGEGKNPSEKRLAFDEIMANQLALALFRKKAQSLKGQSLQGDNSLRKKLLKLLPFELTEGQKQAIKEIEADLISETKMLRLLQGDVGSGKTVVALMGILQAVECGKQAVLMSPTSILAIQHYHWIKPFLDEMGISSLLLTGKEGKKKLEDIKNGNIKVIIGTHALFQKAVEFNDLAYVVIDEQHRFGVNQRLELMRKGNKANLLLMSATPIPRSLVFTMFGDMDNSRLTEKPAGRQDIDTRLISGGRIIEVVEGLKRAIANNEKIYWICPLVSESEKIDLADAINRFEDFKKVFGNIVGLVHGRMKEDEKHDEMERFKAGEIKILIATTVIEVGIDVKDATIMVIEHAERFGLSQLHQLRGRIGRGDKKSTCLLMYDQKITPDGVKRLKIMRETNDGFRIAEADLKIRGAGDLIGTKQSGIQKFNIFDLIEDRDLIKVARQEVEKLMLGGGEELIMLLHLYGYSDYERFI